MRPISFGKSVKKVVVLQREASGQVVAIDVYKKKRKKRKGTMGLRTLGRAVRQLAKAQSAGASDYVERHNEANRKRRDGWLFKLPINVIRSHRKLGKKLFRVP